jgi:transposase
MLFMGMSDREIKDVYDRGFPVVRDTIRRLEQRIESLDKLEERVARLEARNKKDSHNSSKPPSSDGFKRIPRTNSLRGKSGKKAGGQIGHEGMTLEMTDTPDRIETHPAIACRCCGKSLSAVKSRIYERRQVFDIPEIPIKVTEHRAETKECPHCHTITTGAFPERVTQRVQYGLRVQSMAVYFMNYQHLPYERTEEAFRDLFGIDLSHGTIATMNKRCALRLEDAIEWIRNRLIGKRVVHFDETGIRVAKKLRWLHLAGANDATLYTCSDKRGTDGMDAAGILPMYRGTAIHDGWKAYWKYLCSHGLCNAHHLRELIFIAEQYRQKWASRMKRLLLEIKEMVDKCKEQTLSAKTIQRFEREYARIIEEGLRINPRRRKRCGTRGKIAQGAARNLLERLSDYKTEVLGFMYDFNIPFDNNFGERDIRMMKVHEKISGCFRSIQGAEIFCDIRSYISTVKKQGKNVMGALEHAFSFSAVKFLTESE